MSVPGLPTGAANSGGILILGQSQNDVDVFVSLNSPPYVSTFSVIVGAGIAIGSTSALTPAMDFTGFAAGSTFNLINRGRIGGAGGNGGRGGDGFGGLPNFAGAGGGGGAGSVPGLGGGATPLGTVGQPGGALLGGVHGTSLTASSPPFLFTEEGQNGGDAILSGTFVLNITNIEGEIWGGGGGGVGGFQPNPTLFDGSNGGDIATDCEHIGLLENGFAGYAVRGTAVTFISGPSDPNVKGLVGA